MSQKRLKNKKLVPSVAPSEPIECVYYKMKLKC